MLVSHTARFICAPGEEEPITGIEDMLRVSSITQAGEESQRMGAVVCIWGNGVMFADRVQKVKITKYR